VRACHPRDARPFHLLTRKQLRPLHEGLFAWNLASVLFSFVFLKHAKVFSISFGPNNEYAFFYRFFRGGIRINNFFYLNSSNDAFGPLPNPGSREGLELMYVLSVLCLAVLILAALRFIARPRLSQLILDSLAGVVAIFAGPFLYVYAHPFGFEWAPVPFYELFAPKLLLLTLPCSALVWLLYLRTRPEERVATSRNTHSQILFFVFSSVTLLIVSALWLPAWGKILAHAKHPESLSIEMSRTHCQVGCPIYTITVGGDGNVRYVGAEYVRDRGPHTDALSKEQLQSLLQKFDDAGFFSLEDRAFAWGYHTPRVRVFISIDGREKEVSSDTYHVGAKSGPQDLFVQAAAELDKATNSDRWVKCGGRCRP
jgi:hypothetical protein